MILKHIMLSQSNQTLKNIDCLTAFILNIRAGKTMVIEIDQWMLIEWIAIDWKSAEETFRGGRNVLILDLSGDYMGIYNYQEW